jgi:hypothetical protein
MHHDKAQVLLGDLPIAVFHLDVAVYALAMPAARGFVLGPPRLLD